MCEYDAPITIKELQHHWFYHSLVSFQMFRFNGVVYYMNALTEQICDENFNSLDLPARFDKVTLNKFQNYVSINMNDSSKFKQVEITAFMPSMEHFSKSIDIRYYCNDPMVGMFCDAEYIVSLLRFKLFFAIGLLHNFLHKTQFELVIRGGMALRMNLKKNGHDPHGLTAKESATNADMDVLVMMDPEITGSGLELFKTGFMKLLVMTITDMIVAPNSLICRTATGDKNTIKLMLKQRSSTVELADVCFKYSNHDEVIAKHYDDKTNGRMNFYSLPCHFYGLNYRWYYPTMRALEWEYSHIVDSEVLSNVENVFSDVPPSTATLERFKRKMDMTRHKGPNGGKKRRSIRRKKKSIQKN